MKKKWILALCLVLLCLTGCHHEQKKTHSAWWR